MPTPSIRPATPADAAAIAAVHVQSWRETYRNIVPDAFLRDMSVTERTQRWQQNLEDQANEKGVFVLENGQNIDGFVSFGPAREPELGPHGEIYALYLLQRAQGQGMGRKLFEAAQNCLKSLGLKGLYLWVLRDNETLNFYKHLGGAEFAAKTLEIGGKSLEEVAMGWKKD